MANVTETAQWDAGVYQLETTDLVQGGAAGVSNNQAKNLANRTVWLKQQATFKHLKRGVVSPYLEVVGSATVTVNKASDVYGKIVPVYHNDPGGVDTGILSLSTADMTADDYGTVVRFVVSSIEGVKVQVKVGGTTLGELDSGTGYSVEVVWNGTTWELNTDSSFSTVGQVAAYARNSAPQGWLKCNGAAISRSTYASLFKIIGTTFGAGNGTTTFNLPDLRGEFIRGWDDARGIDTGRAFGSAQAASKLLGHVGEVGPGQLAIALENPDLSETYSAQGRTATSTGALISHTKYSARPRNVAMLYCIKF